MESVVVKVEDQVIVAGAREFKTGSKGFYGNGKVVIDGKKYQVSINVVEIGSAKK